MIDQKIRVIGTSGTIQDSPYYLTTKKNAQVLQTCLMVAVNALLSIREAEN